MQGHLYLCIYIMYTMSQERQISLWS